ncbi:hypothetical protein V1478_006035 [Vespula squamosa]|uniref:Uncharacterized protein n=1 Tax=Vespula squamosa TaxID=30214 RepID=A0ABD2B944_VESSQ
MNIVTRIPDLLISKNPSIIPYLKYLVKTWLKNVAVEKDDSRQTQHTLISLFDKKGFSTMHTFPAHAHLQALLQPAELALISVMLVDGTVPGSPTRRQHGQAN